LNTKLHPNMEDIVQVNWDLRWKKASSKYSEFYQLAAKTAQSSVEETRLTKISWKLPSLVVGSLLVFRFNFFLLPFLVVMSFAFMFSRQRTTKGKKTGTYLFVYGTLKKDFHWNSKFLWNSQFICEARTVSKFPLVFGDSGVPYLLGDLPEEGKQILGEIWLVDDVALQNLDEYEGVGKGYYARKNILATSRNPNTSGIAQYEVQVYFKTTSTPTLRKLPFQGEYSMEFHQKNYKAMQHIMAKQQIYMNEPALFVKNENL